VVSESLGSTFSLALQQKGWVLRWAFALILGMLFTIGSAQIQTPTISEASYYQWNGSNVFQDMQVNVDPTNTSPQTLSFTLQSSAVIATSFYSVLDENGNTVVPQTSFSGTVSFSVSVVSYPSAYYQLYFGDLLETGTMGIQIWGAPNPAILSPFAGSTISGSLNVTGATSADNPASSAELYLDGKEVTQAGGALEDMQWQTVLPLNVSQVANGYHTIEVQFLFPNGTTTQCSETVYVSNPIYTLIVQSQNPNSGVPINVSYGNINLTDPTTSQWNVPAGTQVTLNAPATWGTGNFLYGWTVGGNPVWATPTYTFTMTGNVTVVAVYEQGTASLSVKSSNPATGVSVTVSPPDNAGNSNGTTTFTRNYNIGASVTLTAPTTASGNTFQYWTLDGEPQNGSPTLAVSMGGSHAVVAVYQTPTTTCSLSIGSSNPNSGVTISCYPNDNNGQGDGSTPFARTYNTNTVIQLSAPGTVNGNDFQYWAVNGVKGSTNNEWSFTLTSSETVTAVYLPPLTYVNVDSQNPSNGVIVNASPSDYHGANQGSTEFSLDYYKGTSITLSAPLTAGGNNFAYWNLNGVQQALGQANLTFTISQYVNTATAVYVTPWTLTVQSQTPSSGVDVSASPSDNNGSTGQATQFNLIYNDQTTVTLSAPPTASGNNFVSWMLNGSTQAAGQTSLTFTIGQTSTAIAVYATPTFSVYVGSQSPNAGVSIAASPADNNGNGSVTTEFTMSYNVGAQVTFTAPQTAGGNVFEYWTVGGVAQPTGNAVLNITVAANVSVVAVYQSVATIAVDATNGVHAISPLIYGVSSATSDELKDLNFTFSSAGGDAMSTYNWIENCANLGSDWFFETVPDASRTEGEHDDTFMAETKAARAQAAITLPILNYVGKLGSGREMTWSFSQHKYGPQTGWDLNHVDAGNGISTRNGNPYLTNNPNDASTPNSTTMQEGWIEHMVSKWGLSTSGGLKYYLMDNEPSIWFKTHRDVHPIGAKMEEIYEDYLNYASLIREHDASAWILGPEEWGWEGYLYSGYDQQYALSHGWHWLPDRLAHGNLDYVPWLLRQLYRYQQSTGKRLLNALSLHFFPQQGENSNDDSDTMQMIRNESTRELWDPNYIDPASGIQTQVQLVPRMKQWVSEYYPGTFTAVTAYNWGDDSNLNGATTEADILGIFGREGLTLANRSSAPPAGSPTYLAMKMFRNYDGNNSGFGTASCSCAVGDPDQVSAFAASRADGAMTVVVINKVATSEPVSIQVSNFGLGSSAAVWQINSPSQASIKHISSVAVSGGTLSTRVPPQSISLFIIPPASG